VDEQRRDGRSPASAGLRRATIHDVARLAGVSRQTVSRAVNDKAEIDPATKERILDAVRVLGYRPSRFARGLVRRGSITVGLVVPDLTNPYWPEVAVGVLEVAERRDWHVLVSESRADVEREHKVLEALSHQADAIIGQFLGSDRDLARHSAGIPLVLLERDPGQTQFAAVGIDVTTALMESVGHLARAGHRRIGMLDGAPINRPSQRRAHFLAAMRAHGLSADEPGRVAACPEHTVQAGEEAMARLLDAQPAMTAVFGFNDLIAIGAMRTARRRGLRIPDDMAVLGFDGLAVGDLVEPPLTTLVIDKRTLGGLAVDQIVRILTGDPPSTGADAWVKPQLMVRGSA
jgi:LacI family transcriptional regulator